MKSQFFSFLSITAALSFAGLAAPASAAVMQWSGNGHYYEFVEQTTTFQIAADRAASRSHQGLVGHLVTITSQGEQNFILTNLFPVHSQSPTSQERPRYWIGASDAITEGEWRWIEGPDAAETPFYQKDAVGNGGTSLSYSNWFTPTFEPNNDIDAALLGEHFAVGNWATTGEWNDEQGNSVFAYLVEYSQPAQAIPTPALLPGLMGLGMSILRKKKGEAQVA